MSNPDPQTATQYEKDMKEWNDDIYKRIVDLPVDPRENKSDSSLGIKMPTETALRGATIVVSCKCCGDPFTARVADRKRGWAKFCSKSCKAKSQEQRTGQYRSYQERVSDHEDALYSSTSSMDEDQSWGASQ